MNKINFVGLFPIISDILLLFFNKAFVEYYIKRLKQIKRYDESKDDFIRFYGIGGAITLIVVGVLGLIGIM